MKGSGVVLVLGLCACSGGGSAGGGPVGEEQPDTSAPVISGISVVPSGGGTATVGWVTDEPATSSVDYGPTDAYGDSASNGTGLVTNHAVLVTGLEAATTYHFRVTSADGVGNEISTDDATFYNDDDGTGISGELVAWHPVTISFRGPAHTELDDTPNPFLDHRMTVELTGPSGQVQRVPGFFDGDGQGNGAGDIWSVRFVPDEGGEWSYLAHFDTGPAIAIDLDLANGTPGYFDGETGTVLVADRDALADGFYRFGLLEHTGEHYLKFREGPYFLKGGTNGPENLLGFAGFDGTFDETGGDDSSGLVDGLHRFPSHVADWGAGGLGDAQDPLFTSADHGVSSKSLVGALNYLSSVHVNSVFFLTMNLWGSGRDTYPFVGPMEDAFDRTHYDVSKLHQWNRVFEHAQRRGILLHVVLAERKNGSEFYLDNGLLGTQRKLYYREMIARFGHCLALRWNLSEEADYTEADMEQHAAYIRALDPYDHPIGFHTQELPASGAYAKYDQALGDDWFSEASLQGDPSLAGAHVETWRANSAAAGRKWVVDHDEQYPNGEGATDTNADELRRSTLYDVYFSGGNLEWWPGNHALPLGGDMRLEDFRTREDLWNDTWYARSFLQALPFWEMQPADSLLSGESADYGGGEVFCKPGEVYAIYLPRALATGTLDLSGASGDFSRLWYNPRTGAFVGSIDTVTAGGPVAVGVPPADLVSGGYIEEDGLVVVQFESHPLVSGWVEETTWDGYTGDSYYRWAGPNNYGGPAGGVMSFEIAITTPGTYKLAIRNRHNHPQSDLENDVWVRMDDGPWQKVFSNNGSSTVGVWNWASRFDHIGIDAQYDLGAGQHTLEFAGRSTNFMIDRFHLHHPTATDPFDLGHPESPSGAGQGSYEDWVVGFVKQ